MSVEGIQNSGVFKFLLNITRHIASLVHLFLNRVFRNINNHNMTGMGGRKATPQPHSPPAPSMPTPYTAPRTPETGTKRSLPLMSSPRMASAPRPAPEPVIPSQGSVEIKPVVQGEKLSDFHKARPRGPAGRKPPTLKKDRK